MSSNLNFTNRKIASSTSISQDPVNDLLFNPVQENLGIYQGIPVSGSMNTYNYTNSGSINPNDPVLGGGLGMNINSYPLSNPIQGAYGDNSNSHMLGSNSQIGDANVERVLQHNEKLLQAWEALQKMKPNPSNKSDYDKWYQKSIQFRKVVGTTLQKLAKQLGKTNQATLTTNSNRMPTQSVPMQNYPYYPGSVPVSLSGVDPPYAGSNTIQNQQMSGMMSMGQNYMQFPGYEQTQSDMNIGIPTTDFMNSIPFNPRNAINSQLYNLNYNSSQIQLPVQSSALQMSINNQGNPFNQNVFSGNSINASDLMNMPLDGDMFNNNSSG